MNVGFVLGLKAAQAKLPLLLLRDKNKAWKSLGSELGLHSVHAGHRSVSDAASVGRTGSMTVHGRCVISQMA